MGSLSKAVSEQRPSNQDQKQENKSNFDLNVDEIKLSLHTI